jgi:hypothetical protein
MIRWVGFVSLEMSKQIIIDMELGILKNVFGDELL